jgi:uncharacterized iron-regulated membrane protein
MARTYPYVLRLHRWLALAFALPLLVVVATGLILSFEPLAQQVRPERPIAASEIVAHLLRFDPENRARSLAIRTYENTLTIGGIPRSASITIDLKTGEEKSDLDRQGPSSAGAAYAVRFLPSLSWSDIFLTARRMHETLLLDLGRVVVASTIVMLLLVALGVVMGWPALRNTMRSWHQCVAWATLPLLIISPLTALAMAYGVTFSTPGASNAGGERVSMLDAVKLIGAKHDIADLTSIRQRGGRLMARIYVEGELRAFTVSRSDVQPTQRNWPRLIHEGNWGGVVGSALNILTSTALLVLLGTGLTLWIRGVRRRAAGRARAALSAPRGAAHPGARRA